MRIRGNHANRAFLRIIHAEMMNRAHKLARMAPGAALGHDC
jgi:hypothetical protein